MMALYACSLYAMRGDSFAITVGYQVNISSKQESLGYALQMAYEKLPLSEGWHDHKVHTEEIPADIICEAFAQLQEAELCM